jgi:hypothetical protein
MQKCRAKFQLSHINNQEKTYQHGVWNVKELVFQTMYDNTIPEDERFQQATPNGTITMQIDNPAALEFFSKPGEYFYLDFVKVNQEGA